MSNTRIIEAVNAENHLATTDPENSSGILRVTLEAISHRFGSRVVFENVSGSITTGSLGVITGSNGSGKSTLMRIIAGLTIPERGTAMVEHRGIRLDEQQRRPLIGMVAPDLALYRELTGAENLAFFAELKGIKPTREYLIELLSRVGLKGRGRDLVGGYSSGMRQRLKYAFALAGSPQILLLDEPTANLDTDGMAMVDLVIEAQLNLPDGGIVIVATNEPRETGWGNRLVDLEPCQG